MFFGAPMYDQTAWLAPLLLSSLGASAQLIGVVVAMYGVIGLGQAFFGRISDRIETPIGKRRPFLLLGDLLALVALFTLAVVMRLNLASALGMTIAALIVLYLGVQLVQPALYALSLPDLFPSEQRGRVMGTLQMAAVLGDIVMGLLIATTLDVRGYGFAFLALAIFALPSLLTGLFAWEPPRWEEVDLTSSEPAVPQFSLAELKRAFTDVRGYPAVVRFLGFGAVFYFGYNLMKNLQSLYMEKALGFTPGEVGQLVVIIVVMEVLFALVWGWAADRYGKKPTLMLAMGALSLAYLLLALVRTRWQVYAILPLAAAADVSIYILPIALLSDLVPKERSANFIGLYLLTGAAMSVVAPVLAGQVFDRVGMRWLPALAALVLLGVFPILRGLRVPAEPAQR
jgi:MFS family permease